MDLERKFGAIKIVRVKKSRQKILSTSTYYYNNYRT